ncbi:hypothetical protein PMAYCL1PPCAC_22319, partial [Pristionchus mayeri]
MHQIINQIISIYRFVVLFCEKSLHVAFVYIVLGIVFSAKTLYFIATFIIGSPRYSQTYCNRVYSIDVPLIIFLFLWLATLLVAPILSSLLILKDIYRRRQRSSNSGVSIFILLSSLTMATFIGGFA